MRKLLLNSLYFISILFSLNCCSHNSIFYGGKETDQLLNKINSKYNLSVIGTGESNPEEHLEYLILMFESDLFLTPNQARDLILNVTRFTINELNNCTTLKNRLKDNFFKPENIQLNIGFWDLKNGRHYNPYASYVYFSKKGIRVLVDDEWGHSDEALVEDLPPDLLPCNQF